ncbi:MAG: FAD-dependent oxidoreductase, partial [Luteolibacter sp.]
CFRMVLTDVPANRVTIEKPEGYDESAYEILFRAIQAGQKNRFTKFTLMPNRKTDSNNDSGISNNLIGGNYGKDWNWTTLNHDERLALAKKHEYWQRGLLWTLQNHPRVPEDIRTQFLKWGLPKDEFTDNGHWPHQLYVREARRMISDFVMTEHHCRRKQPVTDPIGLGAYAMDSHNVQRHVKNGMLKNEGDIQSGTGGTYGISYRSIVPKKGECENLFVPWSLSASHMAFGSIRMEPVFMALSQSAATAAGIAIERGIATQDVAYDALESRLLADGQKLSVAKEK